MPGVLVIRARQDVRRRPFEAFVLLVVATLVGCAQPSSATDKESVDPVAETSRTSAPACRPSGETDPLVTFAGSPCEWLLLRDATGLRLRSLEDDAAGDATGVMPEACLEHRCRFEGRHTELGPLVVALERSIASEVPAGVHLGVIDGKRLRFVDLWAGAGDSVIGDSTELGPLFALAPYSCEGKLALLVTARFHAAGLGEPPSELADRQGRLRFEGDEARVQPVDRRGCVALDLELP